MSECVRAAIMVMMEAASERARFVNSSIPIEIVDDDELAAIETAFLQVSSVQCSLPHSRAYSSTFGCAQPLQPRCSLAESANYWLSQCSNVQERVRNPDSGTFSVSLLEVHTISSSSCSYIETSLPSSALKDEGQSRNSCCKESVLVEKTILVSSPSAGGESNVIEGGELNSTVDVTRTAAQNGHPQRQTLEAPIPVVQDIEDVPNGSDAANSEKEEAPPEPKPRCLSVTDFTAFVRSLFAVYLVVVMLGVST